MELNFQIENKKFSIEQKKDGIYIDGNKSEGKIHKKNEKSFLVFIKNKPYDIEIVQSDKNKVSLKVNNKIVEITSKNKLDILLEELGMNTAKVQKVNKILAPMPGVIQEVSVKEGQELKEGDTIVVLEAMKMQNVIKVPAEAVVKKVNVKVGEQVAKGQLLVEFN